MLRLTFVIAVAGLVVGGCGGNSADVEEPEDPAPVVSTPAEPYVTENLEGVHYHPPDADGHDDDDDGPETASGDTEQIDPELVTASLDALARLIELLENHGGTCAQLAVKMRAFYADYADIKAAVDQIRQNEHLNAQWEELAGQKERSLMGRVFVLMEPCRNDPDMSAVINER